MTDLGKWLEGNLGRRRVAGEWDCCAFPAAWSILLGTGDPMAEWRGQYSNDAEAELIVGRAGGLAGLFGKGLEAEGWQPVSDPQAGDIGVIALLDEEAGAIYTGRRWAFVTERGLGFASLDREAISHIWRLEARG